MHINKATAFKNKCIQHAVLINKEFQSIRSSRSSHLRLYRGLKKGETFLGLYQHISQIIYSRKQSARKHRPVTEKLQSFKRARWQELNEKNNHQNKQIWSLMLISARNYVRCKVGYTNFLMFHPCCFVVSCVCGLVVARYTEKKQISAYLTSYHVFP